MPDKPISTEEYDALMEAVQSGNVGPAADAAQDRQVKLYDFSRPDKFSKEQLRALEMIHSNLARGLTTQLSALLRTPAEVEMASIAETSYLEFFETITHPASIALLSMDPLVGRALLEMDADVSFALIDRMLGGPGNALGEARELTEIEKGLMGRIVDRIAKCVNDSWSTMFTLRAELEMIIGSTLFGQIALPDDRMVLVRYEVRIGSVAGHIHVGIPVTALDPILSRLTAQQWFASERNANNETMTEAIRHALDRTELPVVMELGKASVTVRDLLELQVGDLVCLDRKAGADLDLRIGHQVKFRGQPGQVGRRIGLLITQRMDGGEAE